MTRYAVTSLDYPWTSRTLRDDFVLCQGTAPDKSGQAVTAKEENHLICEGEVLTIKRQNSIKTRI